jgi:hypothetical protein
MVRCTERGDGKHTRTGEYIADANAYTDDNTCANAFNHADTDAIDHPRCHNATDPHPGAFAVTLANTYANTYINAVTVANTHANTYINANTVTDTFAVTNAHTSRKWQ